MKSPALYDLKKITLQDLIRSNFKMANSELNQIKDVDISQQYNQLFRMLLRMNRIENKKIKDVIFVDCSNNKKYQKELTHILKHGFKIGFTQFQFYGKSASMGRNGILAFLSEEVYKEVNEKAMMGLELDNTVISKFEAYKHLLFSSCFCIEGKLPYMIVVKDYEKTIENVNIKYVDEIEKEYIDKQTGEIKKFKEKVIKEGIKDIDLNTNDGAGLCSFEIADKWTNELEIPYTPSVFMLRIPYVKGLVARVDFKNYYKEKNITQIKDIWGKIHNVNDIDIILTESQFKGYKYFKFDNTYNDWLEYLNRLEKYDHCLGIAKWNYSHEDEPKKTRANYQILQTLNLTDDDLWEMSKYTRDWIEKILDGDLDSAMCYLGLTGNPKPSNNYMKALLINQNMINDKKIKSYLFKLLRKTIDELKTGKMFLDGAFKILLPDVVMMLEHIAGLEPVGCLKKGEMFAKEHLGEYVLNRNPHISASEHAILNAVNNEQTRRWCSHFENVCMLNGYDVTAPSLNGCDFDGDLAFVHRNKIFMKGIRRNLPIVLDVEDKITAIAKPYTHKNLIGFTKMSLDSRIGEISNCSSAYCNKTAKTKDIEKSYEDITCLLSVINGKEIDYAKTGVRWNVPRIISKHAKPLPYFLKYKYPNLSKLSKSPSPMNKFCWKIENWQRALFRKNVSEYIDTSKYIINESIPFNEEVYEKISKNYKFFKSEFNEYKHQENMEKNYSNYKEFLEGLNYKDIKHTEIDWDSLYEKYRKVLTDLVPNQSELANYLIRLTYIEDKGRKCSFAWNIAEEGIMTNLRNNRSNDIYIPFKDDEGDIEYLGNKYSLKIMEGGEY